jgi:hypothetical protein
VLPLFLAAEAFGQRPSTLLRGAWADLQLDVAVLMAGRAALAARSAEAPAAPAGPAAPPPGGFASVRGLARPAPPSVPAGEP